MAEVGDCVVVTSQPYWSPDDLFIGTVSEFLCGLCVSTSILLYIILIKHLHLFYNKSSKSHFLQYFTFNVGLWAAIDIKISLYKPCVSSFCASRWVGLLTEWALKWQSKCALMATWSMCRSRPWVHTVTSHALVYEAVEQRATVVAEGRAGVGVDLKLVLRPWVLQGREEGRIHHSETYSVTSPVLFSWTHQTERSILNIHTLYILNVGFVFCCFFLLFFFKVRKPISSELQSKAEHLISVKGLNNLNY